MEWEVSDGVEPRGEGGREGRVGGREGRELRAGGGGTEGRGWGGGAGHCDGEEAD